MNETNVHEIRNSDSHFDKNGFLYLFFDEKITSHEYRIFAPTNAITITKNLDVLIDPRLVYRDNLKNNRKIYPPKGYSFQVELSPEVSYRLKYQHKIIEDVKSFKNFHNLHIGAQYFIKRIDKNSTTAIQVNVQGLRATGPKNVSKLNVLFNTALHHEEYELAGIIHRTIHKMLSSTYTAGVQTNKNYAALLTK